MDDLPDDAALQIMKMRAQDMSLDALNKREVTLRSLCDGRIQCVERRLGNISICAKKYIEAQVKKQYVQKELLDVYALSTHSTESRVNWKLTSCNGFRSLDPLSRCEEGAVGSLWLYTDDPPEGIACFDSVCSTRTDRNYHEIVLTLALDVDVQFVSADTARASILRS